MSSKLMSKRKYLKRKRKRKKISLLLLFLLTFGERANQGTTIKPPICSRGSLEGKVPLATSRSDVSEVKSWVRKTFSEFLQRCSFYLLASFHPDLSFRLCNISSRFYPRHHYRFSSSSYPAFPSMCIVIHSCSSSCDARHLFSGTRSQHL